MDDGRDALAPRRADIARNRHETAGIGIDGIHVEYLGCLLLQDHRSKRHELGAIEPLVEKVVRFPPRRIGEDRTGAERPRPIFHATGLDRAEFAAGEARRGGLDRIAGKPPDPANPRKNVVNLLAVIAAQINVAQTTPLGEPTSDSISFKQV